ncbi:MAG: phospholipase D-like domain-containing protein [Candidatus Solibacter sp.]
MRKQSETGSRQPSTKLLIQPGDGIDALLEGIARAKKCIEIAIFRFDQTKIEQALEKAVGRGVAVSALIASVNRAGEKHLRALELRLLGAGVKVARTASDLVRYHAKYMVVDQRWLYVLGFNWTHADIERSRSFGLITRNPAAVREAMRLFDADSRRVPVEPPPSRLVVSPLNARRQLASFLLQARKELVIYDPKVGDKEMLKILAKRAKAGVKIRILGKIQHPIAGVQAHKLAGLRLHTRTIVRDATDVFVGSQSLRAAELEVRREVGLIVRDQAVVTAVLSTFEADWEETEQAERVAPQAPLVKMARRLARAVVKKLPAVVPNLNGKSEQEQTHDPEAIAQEVAEIVKDAVKAGLGA